MKCDLKFLDKCKYAVVLPSVLVILAAVWLGVDIYNKMSESENVITVSATSEVYAKPDLALSVFSVLSEAKTVAEALQDNTSKMNAIIAFVKSQGVEDKDVKTTNFSVSPRYEWHELTSCSSSYCPSEERVLVGYEVSQSLQVKIRDLTKVGEIIQGATDAGANQVGDLQFTIDNEDTLKEEARGKAIEEVKAKAGSLASQLGIRLVKIIQFNESGETPIYYPTYAKASETSGMGGAVPDIQTGENKISVTVTLTYQIR
ncbi:MAG: SIMPL domain-containing protein [Candidatus Omnitrophica bacterium]|nr:SIMPL domain-containing protein [Candidatus Omnitrophota bacterium]